MGKDTYDINISWCVLYNFKNYVCFFSKFCLIFLTLSVFVPNQFITTHCPKFPFIYFFISFILLHSLRDKILILYSIHPSPKNTPLTVPSDKWCMLYLLHLRIPLGSVTNYLNLTCSKENHAEVKSCKVIHHDFSRWHAR